MKVTKRLSTTVFLFVSAVLASLLPGLTAAAPDNQGNEFILGFMQNLSGSNENTVLFLTGSTATTATVEAPGIGFGPTGFAITPGSITLSLAVELDTRDREWHDTEQGDQDFRARGDHRLRPESKAGHYRRFPGPPHGHPEHGLPGSVLFQPRILKPRGVPDTRDCRWHAGHGHSHQ